MNINSQKILITGGTGFIGSHTAVKLLESGFDIIILDNLSNSDQSVVNSIQALSGKNFTFIEGDIRNDDLLDQIFNDHQIMAVIHFAGLKAVAESMEEPLKYFDNNIQGTISLVKAMQKAQVYTMIFSSSATVYDEDNQSPLVEDMPATAPKNNYGYTKLCIEQILQKLSASDPNWSIASLRYFNPIGAHPSGQIGENPKDIPNNLLPYINQVAAGQLEYLSIFGNDYPTTDGIGVRDYIHVVDLAIAHVNALENRLKLNGYKVWNIGTGKGYSVLEVIQAFEDINQVKIPYKIAPRRQGDIAISFADNSLACKELNWTPQYQLEDMLADAWRWQQKIE